MVQFHTENQALATLAVQDRETSRYLLFDEQLQLCGRRSGRDQKTEFVRSSQQMQALAFSGIHVISPRLLRMMMEEGVFSIITSYLRLAAQGEKILAFRADEYYWRDLGRTDPSLYVGAETCKTCHEDIFKNFETTPHFVTTLENKRGPEWQGCEACHGPGKEHVESGGDKTKIFTFKGVSAQSVQRALPGLPYLRRRTQ